MDFLEEKIKLKFVVEIKLLLLNQRIILRRNITQFFSSKKNRV
jgi:hypothetical protein